MSIEVTDKVNKLLSCPDVLIKDPEIVKKKIVFLANDSAKNLQFVADFDCTLTKRYTQGSQRCWSSFAAVECYSKFSNEFREKLDELCKFYLPLDADPSIAKEKKIAFILEWNRLATELYITERMSKDDIKDAVAVSLVKVREGFASIMEKLCNADIPFLILSAGLGDTIDHILANMEIPNKTLSVISNYFTFDENGFVCGMTKPLITTGNKGNAAEINPAYFASVKDRKNVVLLGDRIEDLQMSSCFDGIFENMLTVGFLNENIELQKNLYMKNYDVVLLGDPDLSWIEMLLEIIV